ncbi:MAG: aldo/keto reductase [Anaerovoracaceae bacterium]|nr:aldo/keto reductase [Anaerovoracaceae bacterium]
MEYRKLPGSDEKISIIGMGSSVIGEQAERDIIETVQFAMDSGINYFDMAGGHASIFSAYGRALQGCRKDAMLQIHFGADYVSGEYGWSTDLDTVRRSVHWQLEKLKTDYIDFGFIHCIDEEADLASYEENGVLAFLMDMKRQGVVKHIGLSTHSPGIANMILDRNILDIMMFSINPMYDYGQGDYAIGSDDERQRLYRRCEKEGVGISVMKPFNGGQLLDARQSPFHRALTPAQCIQYALDKPGVLTVLGGPANINQLKDILSYLDADEEQRDYSIISTLTPDESVGKCVYCKHCHPCPANLDIGLINKYYDLAMQGDTLAREHYLTLERTASDCTECGHCDSRCPFKVMQTERMKEIKNYFGK